VVLYERRKREATDEGGVMARLGVRPEQVPAFLALVGDTADGIPGVPRWGEKSAAKVLATYARIEDIPDDPAHWQVDVRGKAALARELAEARERVALYEQLAILRTDVPLAEELADLRWRGTRPELVALCRELEISEPPPGLPAI
jgi:5'-3' exonuclease